MVFRVFINNLPAARIMQKEHNCSVMQVAANLWDLGTWHTADLQAMSNADWWWVRTYIDLIEVAEG